MNDAKPRRTLGRYGVPLLLLALVAIIVIVFNAVVLPFFVAAFVAFLIEPAVARISGAQRGRFTVSRALAVVMVYGIGVGGLALFSVLFLPRLANEVASLAVDAPQMLREFREERLPPINARLERLLRSVLPVSSSDAPVRAAVDQVAIATDAARARAEVIAALSPQERAAYHRGAVDVRLESDAPTQDPVLLRIRVGGEGTFEVLPGDDDVAFAPEPDGAWRLTRATDETAEPGTVDVERALTESFGQAVEGGGDALHGVIVWTQRVIAGLVHTVWLSFITLMIAAFLSVDAPRISAYIHGLFPSDRRSNVGDFLTRLGVGLSGVIRGQLVICAINGVLTGVGLALLGIKFAVVLACIAAAFSLIPIFGTILSAIPAVAIAITQSLTSGVLVLAWILGIHFIEANVLNPRIMGTAAKIHPVIVIFALLAGEHSFGLVGALLAVPAASIVQTTFQFIRDQASPHTDPTGEAVHEDQVEFQE